MSHLFDFYGVHVRVSSNDPGFLEFVARNFSYFRRDGTAVRPRVEAFYDAGQTAVFPPTPAALYRKIAANGFLGERSAVLADGGLVFSVVFGEGVLSVRAGARMTTPWRDALKRTLGRQEDYFLLARKLVLFPVFHLLEREPGVFLLHASAVSCRGQAVVVAGMAGVGKSTAAVSAFVQHPRTVSFLSDNYLLFDDHRVYAFPEFIRLHAGSVRLSGAGAALGKPVLRRCGRDYYLIGRDFISAAVPPAVLLIPSLGNGPRLKALSRAQAIDRLLLAHDQVREFQHYHALGLLAYGDYGENSLYKRRIDALEKLLSGVRLFEVNINWQEKWFDEFLER